MRVKRQRFKNIPKHCPVCNSSIISSDGIKFKCDKCGFIHEPSVKTVKFVTYSNMKTEIVLFLD